MSKFWKFTNRILFILAVISLPVIHFFTGSALAGNLANFVLSLLLVLFGVGIGHTMDESSKARSGKLSEEKLAKFLKAFKPLDSLDKTLFGLSRAAWVVGIFVMAACGYEWFAGLTLLFWLLWIGALSVARDSAEVVRLKAAQGV